MLTPNSVGSIFYSRAIGSGSYSYIYKVDVPTSPQGADSLSRSFAVKLARDEFSGETQPIEREAALLRDLDHPNIVKVYASWQSYGRWCMAMDCFDCNTYDLLEERGALDLGSTLYVLGELAKALGHLHERGLAHGDVKPQNLLLRGDTSQPSNCSVVLTDYDIARPSGEKFSWEREELVVGTPNYLTKERWWGDSPRIRHDIYAAACTTYEFLGGSLTSRGFHFAAQENMEAIAGFDHADERIAPLLFNMVHADGSIKNGIDLVRYLKEFLPEIGLGG